MKIVYATRRVPNMVGCVFRNPRHFSGPEKGAKKVFIDGDWPEIRDAYRKAKVPVANVSDLRQAKPKAADPSPANPD